MLHWKTRERQAALAMSEDYWLAQISRGKALSHFSALAFMNDSVMSKYAYHTTSA
jgi:hypothetical protein